MESLAKDEKREKTVLDDIISALQFVIDSVGAAHVKQPKKKQRTVAGQGTTPRSAEATLKGMGFCLSMFLEFAFEGTTTVNGKCFKSYSALRPELQQVMLAAQETFSTEASDGKEVDAIELATLLTESFVDKPVHTIIGAMRKQAVFSG